MIEKKSYFFQHLRIKEESKQTSFKKARHVSKYIDMSESKLLLEQLSIENSNKKHLLTGLHACGNLSVFMVKNFARDSRIESLVSVACCYMKMVDKEQTKSGFPISDYMKKKNASLGYKSLELACHSNENYQLRFTGK